MGGSSRRDYLSFDCAMKDKGQVRCVYMEPHGRLDIPLQTSHGRLQCDQERKWEVRLSNCSPLYWSDRADSQEVASKSEIICHQKCNLCSDSRSWVAVRRRAGAGSGDLLSPTLPHWTSRRRGRTGTLTSSMKLTRTFSRNFRKTKRNKNLINNKCIIMLMFVSQSYVEAVRCDERWPAGVGVREDGCAWMWPGEKWPGHTRGHHQSNTVRSHKSLRPSHHFTGVTQSDILILWDVVCHPPVVK